MYDSKKLVFSPAIQAEVDTGRMTVKDAIYTEACHLLLVAEKNDNLPGQIICQAAIDSIKAQWSREKRDAN